MTAAERVREARKATGQDTRFNRIRSLSRADLALWEYDRQRFYQAIGEAVLRRELPRHLDAEAIVSGD